MADRLKDVDTNALVLPAFGRSGYLDDELVRTAVDTGVPVWVFPLHRRVDADHFFSRGVQGAICSSYGYISHSSAITTRDTWASRAIASGEMTKDPADPEFAPSWESGGALALARQGSQHFVTLGQMSPIAMAAASYQIDFEACFTRLPTDRAGNLTLAFGQSNDAYYEHQAGKTTGYHAILRVDGRLALFLHHAGVATGQQLGSSIETAQPKTGEWMRFRLEVTPASIRWTRAGGGGEASILSHDTSARGGYLHIGRSAEDGAVAFRNFVIT